MEDEAHRNSSRDLKQNILRRIVAVLLDFTQHISVFHIMPAELMTGGLFLRC